MFNNNKQTILVTGCAGFIGSNFVPYFLDKYKEYNLVNLDLLTYAGDLANLKECENNPRYKFIKGDICNRELVEFISSLNIQDSKELYFEVKTEFETTLGEVVDFINEFKLNILNENYKIENNDFKQKLFLTYKNYYGKLNA